MKIIPYGRQWIDEEDIAAVVDVLKGDWLTQGPNVEKFEKAVADYIGVKYAVAFNSGTAALHAAMFAAGVREGDEIITSPITFVATSNSAVYLGAKPVFVDIDLKTYCIDTQRIEEKITPKTKVIAPVDLAGYPVDIKPIIELAKKYGLVVIEDAAHALGAKRYGKMVGQEADMTMFSFHPVKHITTGEGGIIVTNNVVYAEKMRLFRTHGITKKPEFLEKNDGPWYYEMHELGFNYRITDFQCALGLSQLKKIEDFLRRRNEIARRYDAAFEDIPQIVPAPSVLEPDRHAYHLYPILLNGVNRKDVYLKLREKGIYTQIHYIPIHMQPYYRKRFGYKKGEFPNAEYYYENELSIPMYPKMTDEDLEYVIKSLKEVIQRV